MRDPTYIIKQPPKPDTTTSLVVADLWSEIGALKKHAAALEAQVRELTARLDAKEGDGR